MTAFQLPSPAPQVRHNFRRLYLDVIWYGVLAGSTIAFLAVYAARLGASNFEVGLLSAAPAVVNLIFTLPSGRWLEGRPLISTTFWSSLGQRSGYLLLIALPWMLSERAQVWGMIWITLLVSIPGTLLAIAFNAMFADVTPAEYRADVVGKRNALIAVSVTLSTLASGQILDRVIFPLNYQIVFVIGALGAAMSSYHLSRLRQPNEPPLRVWQLLGDFGQPGRWAQSLRHAVGLRFLTRSAGKPLLRLDVLRGPFGLFMAAYLAFYTFQYFALPIFPLYYVNVLSLTDGQISLGSALFYAMSMLVSLRLSYLSARFGHRRLLVAGALLLGQYPLLLAFARDATLYYVAAITGGLVFGVLNGGLVNRLMERVPENDRPAHMALHNLALNLGILIGSLLGPLAGDWLGLRDALYLSAALRLLAGIFLWVAG
jgi:MFS family permease